VVDGTTQFAQAAGDRMIASSILASLPTAPEKSPLEQARESWHSNECPACGGLKQASKHWFCYDCWKNLPIHIRSALLRMRPGWITFWIQACAALSEAK